MPTYIARSEWNGDPANGHGSLRVGSGAFVSQVAPRTEQGQATNPEEVIGAALASCYAQSLSRMLSDGGQEPRCVRVTAAVDIVFADGSTHIPQISLDAEIDGLDLDVDQLQQVSQQAADRCPICGALAGTTIRINARPAPPPGD